MAVSDGQYLEQVFEYKLQTFRYNNKQQVKAVGNKKLKTELKVLSNCTVMGSFLNKKKASKDSKVNVHKHTVRPVLLYENQT